MVSKKRPRTVYFPIDCIKGTKAKKLYMNNGEVVCSYMYELITEIPTLEEIRAMDKKVGRNLIINLRKNHNGKKLSEQWGITTYSFYNHLLKEFEITTKDRPVKNKLKQDPDKQDPKKLESKIIYTNENAIGIAEKPQVQVEKEFVGFAINFANTLTGEELSNQILNIMGMLDKESKYKFSVKLNQCFK